MMDVCLSTRNVAAVILVEVFMRFKSVGLRISVEFIVNDSNYIFFCPMS